MKDDILKLRNEGKSYNEIKKILGCSKSTISYYCGEGQKEKNYLRVKKNRKNPKIEINTCSICKLEKENLSYKNRCKECSILYEKEYDKNYHKKWVENNKDKVKNYNKKNRSEYNKNYKKINKIKINQQNYIRRKTRYENDSLYKFKVNLSSMLRKAFANKGFKKNINSETIYGCTYKELYYYIESKFEPWMNWENKGLYNGELNYGWDLDHIIPICEAKTESDLVRLNHFTNLQPLCSKINRNIKNDNPNF